MKRTLISEASAGQAKVSGFVENFRDKRAMAFIVLRDISGKLQIFIDKENNPDAAKVVEGLTLESVITVEGEIVENPGVKLGGREMIPSKITVESAADALPINDGTAIDGQMDYRWLGLRKESNTLMFKAQTVMVNAMRKFLLDKGFIEIHTPKLIGAASETGSDVFELEYFDRKAYLSQSPQFYKQMAMASGFERIFEVGPVFRAEKSYTSKHATEFTGFDLEFSYIESYRDVMKLEEELLRDMLEKLSESYGEDLERAFGVPVVIPSLPFPVMTLAEVYTELEARYGFTVPKEEQGDLDTEAERLCAKLSMDKFGHEFLFVIDFSADKRAFYHMRENGVPQGYDLIWRGVEITTGAQREHRYDVLKAQADEKGLGADVEFYTEFFRYGCPPHGGFGVGVDRMTMMITGLGIKEAMFLFRGPNRLTP